MSFFSALYSKAVFSFSDVAQAQSAYETGQQYSFILEIP